MELLIISTADNKGYSYTYQFLAEKFNKQTIEMAEWYLKKHGDLLDEEHAYLQRGSRTIIEKGITKEMKLNQNVVWLERYEDEYQGLLDEQIKLLEEELEELKKKK